MIKPVSLLRLVSAAVLALPVLAHAAGLGRLTVGSYLGQPLRAEIEVVSLQPGEEDSLEARLASGNAFAQAGIEFNAALNTMQFAVDKRGGRPVILVTTREPVNEPFLDVLVELRWATGLFVREYTLLLDPPGYEGPKPQPAAAAPAAERAATAAPAGTAAAERAPAAPTAPAASEVSPAPRVEARPMDSAAAPAAPKPAEATEPKPSAAEGAAAPPPVGERAPESQQPQTYEVKKGDTLGEIALRYRPAGVTYHQMLIALQRANEDAFIRSNINLVRAGRILAIPDAEAAAAVDAADANRLVFAQHADFADYRSRLASAVAAAPSAAQPAEQSAAGPITVQPEPPKPAAPSDQLKLSRADAKKPGAAQAAREDNLAASQRALQEAQSRVTELEKNVGDLKKLLEIRDQQLAQLQEKAAKPAPSAPPPVAAKAPESPKPAPAPQAAKAPEAKPAAPSPAPAAEAPKPAAPPAPQPAAETPKPAAEAPKPAAEAPKPAPKPPVAAAKPKPRPAAPPPPPPSFLEELLEDPITTFGGIGVVVLLLGGYGYWAWQRKKKSVAKFKDSVLGTASLAPVAGAEAAGGTASVAPVSVSQSAAGGVDADDVDPIAEADVYMAYGRDTQAEEILKEALQRDPNRLAVHAKLLEIYANRRDPQAFEQTALKLKGATGGAGPEWDKAMALGRSIDPANGLYGGAGETTPTPVPAFAAAAAAAPAPAVDFDIGGGTPSEPTMAAAPSIDLDIGGPAPAPAPTPEEKSDFSPGGTLIIDSEDSKAATSGLDFDLGGAGDKAPDTAGGLNFELPASAPAPAPAEAAAAGQSSGGLDFDLNLGGGAGESKDASAPALDLSAISLDLGTPAETPAAGGGNGDAKWQEVATKLDLAKAYEEMGDKDGARELLNEVLREGDSAQQGQANQLLAKLG